MNLTDFHFAQPLWLWAFLLLPAGYAWLSYCRRNVNKRSFGGLEKFADRPLLQHILLNSFKTKRGMALGFIFAMIVALFILALANPRWKYTEIEAFTPNASMVILLDLGEQMSARDVQPSRVIRARQYIQDLITASKGLKIGLIGFTAKPHLISPITDDLQTLKNYLPALDTFLSTKQGDNLSAALKYAHELLESEPGIKKSILLISDGNFIDKNFTSVIEEIVKDKIAIHVVGVGTITGAPYMDPAGRMKRERDALAISKLNQPVLRIIAKSGNGVYAEANHFSQGIDSILHKAQYIESNEPHISGKVRQWQDSYYWFLIPAGVLFGLLLTQRALYIVPFIMLFNLGYSDTSYAYSITDAFRNSEQRGAKQYQITNFSEAANEFNDQYRKGVALYRAGDYAAAEQMLLASERPAVRVPAMYNAGNAQMQQKKWRSAIRSYEQVLAWQPDHEDAKFNLELAKKMLEKDDCECNNNNNKSDKEDKNNSGDDSTDKNDRDKKSNQGQQDSQSDSKEQKDDDKQTDSNQDRKNDNQQSKNDNPDQNERDSKQEQNNQEQQAQNAAADTAKADQQHAQQEARAQQWFNRLNSDIRVFLQNKFYVEDMVDNR